MPKTFPGEAPELDSLTAQRGRSQTKSQFKDMDI